MTIDNRYDQMWESLQDPEYRKQLIDEHINVGIAFQINGIRQRQKLTQKDLAQLLGDIKKQPLISSWENPNYGRYTLNTLKDLAKALDVGLLVRFVPFSKMIDWTVNLTEEAIAPASFTEEQSGISYFNQVSRMLDKSLENVYITDANEITESKDNNNLLSVSTSEGGTI